MQLCAGKQRVAAGTSNVWLIRAKAAAMWDGKSTHSADLGMSEVQVDGGILLLRKAACQTQGRERDWLCRQRPHRACAACTALALKRDACGPTPHRKDQDATTAATNLMRHTMEGYSKTTTLYVAEGLPSGFMARSPQVRMPGCPYAQGQGTAQSEQDHGLAAQHQLRCCTHHDIRH